jgi:hypothetical protein
VSTPPSLGSMISGVELVLPQEVARDSGLWAVDRRPFTYGRRLWY